MAKTFTAPFAQTPKTGTAVVTAAAGNAATDAPTGAVLLATAGADGAIVTRITAIPRTTISSTGLLLFLVKSASPSVYRLIDSEQMATYAESTSAATPETTFANFNESTPLRLEAGDMLYAASKIAATSGIVFKAEWTDF